MPGETVVIRTGHLLSVHSNTIEILECPESPADDVEEVTKFIDLRTFDLEQKKGHSKRSFEVKEAPGVVPKAIEKITKSSKISKRAQVGSAASHSSTSVPISFNKPTIAPAEMHGEIERFPNPESNFEPVESASLLPKPVGELDISPKVQVEGPSSKPALNEPKLNSPFDSIRAIASDEMQKPRQIQKPTDDESNLKIRNRTFKKVAAVAVLGVSLSFVANQLAKSYLIFDFDSGEDLAIPIVVNKSLKRQNPKQVAITNTGNEGNGNSVEGGRGLASSDAPAPVTAPQVPLENSNKVAKQRELMNAIEEGKLDEVAKLLGEDGMSIDFTLDEIGRTPLVRAAAAGRLSVLQYLLSKKSSLTAVDYNGNNALMWATINGHEQTVTYLVKLGFDLEAKREDGKTVFGLAKLYHQTGIERILRAANRSKGSFSQRTPASK